MSITIKEIFCIFDYEQVLIPLSITHLKFTNQGYVSTFKVLHIFGFRLAKWNTMGTDVNFS